MQFQILGPLRVTGENGDVALGGAKPAAVLAMLLLRPNELVPADRLIEDLWEGSPPPTASKTLQVHMSRLRRALGESPIETTSGGYILHVEKERIDALRFEQLVLDGRAALVEGEHTRASRAMREALALWRGDALADFSYASFAQETIARLDGLRLVALESAVEAELALGRHTELVPELKFLVKRQPLSEHLRAQLMLALYRSGRQAEALGVYRAARRILVDELGIEPGAELRELERAILEQDPKLLPPEKVASPLVERRSSRGTLVGYEGELRTLQDLLETAISGRGCVGLIAGEPGAGKTRLCDELTTVARERRARVVWGRCRSGGGAPAYWPWVQIMRALGAGVLEGSQTSDRNEVRFQLFDAVANAIAKATDDGPLLIVVDDLHVADKSSLELLEFVAPAILDESVVLVGAYRDTEADLEETLRSTLSELARTTDCTQLVLTGMSEAATTHFVEINAGVAPMPQLAAALHETSGGNPLFVTELVRLLRAEDRLRELAESETLTLPRGVEHVIARRLDHLSDGCRQTVAFASAIGRDFDLTLLAPASGRSADELLRELDEALAARVIGLASDAAFRFTHDLVRQTLYKSLGETEQRRAHAAIAEAVEQMNAARPEPVASLLAHHFSTALPLGDAQKTIRYLTLAGDEASRQGALYEAADYYRRAADLGRSTGMAPGDLCELCLLHAEHLVLVEDIKGAIGVLEETEVLAREAPDEERDGRLTLVRAHTRLLDALALDEEEVFSVIEMCQRRDDPASESRAWAALVTINCGRSNRLKGGEAAERMIDCARRAGSKALLGQAMRSAAGNYALGSTPVGVAIPRIHGFLNEIDDPQIRARLLNQVAGLTSAGGQHDEARALLDQARAICPAAFRAEFESYASATATHIEWRAGNYARAAEHGRETIAVLERQGLVRYLSSEACFLVDPLIELGEFEEAEALLERARPWAAADDEDALMRQARSWARLARARGDLDRAEAAAREAMTHVNAPTFDAVDEEAETLLLLAEILRARGDDAEAREHAETALRVAEERGHVVLTEQARTFLAEPALVA